MCLCHILHFKCLFLVLKCLCHILQFKVDAFCLFLVLNCLCHILLQRDRRRRQRLIAEPLIATAAVAQPGALLIIIAVALSKFQHHCTASHCIALPARVANPAWLCDFLRKILEKGSSLPCIGTARVTIHWATNQMRCYCYCYCYCYHPRP